MGERTVRPKSPRHILFRGVNLQENLSFKAYLELVKIGIGTSDYSFDFNRLNNEDWEFILEESRKQATVLLCFDALKYVNSKPFDELYNKWLLWSAKITSENISNFKEQTNLTKLLDDNSIPYVILKGWSSAYYYPKPDNRSFGDIDFLVNKADIQKSVQLLLDNGFKMEKDLSSVHYEFHKNKTRFELHKTIAGIPQNKYGAYFNEIISSAVIERIVENGNVRIGDLHHGVIILLHTLHHLMSYGLGIRHLCDWACFVNKTKTYDFWTSKFIPLLKKTGTFKFMCGLTIVCVKYLGVVKPDWCVDVTDDMVDTITNEVFGSGNFGSKNKVNKSLLMTMRDSEKITVFSKIKAMIGALNKTNHIVFPILKKLPILYPFIMIYRVLRYLVLMFMGKKSSLIEASKHADERNAVYMKYELFKVEDEVNE